MFKNICKGFTLIELIIVIAIIAVLTVVFLPTIRGSQAKARDAARVALVNDMVTAMENQINDGVTIPVDGGAATGVCLTYGAAPGSTIASYLGRVPQSWGANNKTNLCAANGVWYNKFGTGNNYIFAIQVELTSSGNVIDYADTAAAITAVKGYDSVANVITGTATAPSVDTDGDYYVVAK